MSSNKYLYVIVANSRGRTYEQCINIFQDNEPIHPDDIEKHIKKYVSIIGSEYYIADWYIS